MYENNLKYNKLHNFILEEMTTNQSNKKVDDPTDKYNHDSNVLKDLARELKQSVNESRKIISGEAVKGVVDKINSIKISNYSESILDMPIFPKKKVVNDVGTNSVKKRKNFKKPNTQLFTSEKPSEDKKKNKEKQDRFLIRVKENIEKKKSNLIIKSSIQKDEELKNNKTTEISKTTKNIIDTKFAKSKPIYERAQNIIDHRDINLNFLKQMYNKEEELKSSQRTCSVGKIEKFDKKKFDEWVYKKMDWYQEKSTKISRICEDSEKIEIEALRILQKNSSLDRSVMTNQDKDQIFTRLNKSNVGNIKLSKFVKHHYNSLMPSPLVRSPRFKKDFANKSLNVSLDIEKVKKGKFYSSANSPRRNEDTRELESNYVIGTNTSTVLSKILIKTIDERSVNNEEVSNINKVNKQKFSFFRSNSLVNKKSGFVITQSPKFNDFN